MQSAVVSATVMDRYDGRWAGRTDLASVKAALNALRHALT
jgi:hypothetical protein